MHDLIARLNAAKQKTTAVPANLTPKKAAPTLSDLVAPLQNMAMQTGTGLQRLTSLTQRLSIAHDAATQQKVLLDIIDLLAETLALEKQNINMRWTEHEKYDVAVLSQGLQLVAARMNQHAPEVVQSLLATKPAYLHRCGIDPDKDPRHIGYVIAAAAQLVAEQQLSKNHTAATKNKRNRRKSNLEIALEGGAEGGADDIFAAIFDSIPTFEKGQSPNANGTSKASADDGDEDDPFDFSSLNDEDDDSDDSTEPAASVGDKKDPLADLFK